MPVTLQTRDYALMMRLWRLHTCSTAHLQRDLFSEEILAVKRLQALRGARYLQDYVINNDHHPQVWQLTTNGMKALAEEHPDKIKGPWKNPSPSKNHAHHLVLCDVLLYLDALCRVKEKEVIWNLGQGGLLPDVDIKATFSLCPNALAVIGPLEDSTSVKLALEMDTKNGTQELWKRLSKYYEAMKKGTIHELWWVVHKEGRRKNIVTDHLERAGLGELTRVLTLSHCLERPIQVPPPFITP